LPESARAHEAPSEARVRLMCADASFTDSQIAATPSARPEAVAALMSTVSGPEGGANRAGAMKGAPWKFTLPVQLIRPTGTTLEALTFLGTAVSTLSPLTASRLPRRQLSTGNGH